MQRAICGLFSISSWAQSWMFSLCRHHTHPTRGTRTRQCRTPQDQSRSRKEVTHLRSRPHFRAEQDRRARLEILRDDDLVVEPILSPRTRQYRPSHPLTHMLAKGGTHSRPIDEILPIRLKRARLQHPREGRIIREGVKLYIESKHERMSANQSARSEGGEERDGPSREKSSLFWNLGQRSLWRSSQSFGSRKDEERGRGAKGGWASRRERGRAG